MLSSYNYFIVSRCPPVGLPAEGGRTGLTSHRERIVFPMNYYNGGRNGTQIYSINRERTSCGGSKHESYLPNKR